MSIYLNKELKMLTVIVHSNTFFTGAEGPEILH